MVRSFWVLPRTSAMTSNSLPRKTFGNLRSAFKIELPMKSGPYMMYFYNANMSALSAVVSIPFSNMAQRMRSIAFQCTSV